VQTYYNYWGEDIVYDGSPVRAIVDYNTGTEYEDADQFGETHTVRLPGYLGIIPKERKCFQFDGNEFEIIEIQKSIDNLEYVCRISRKD